MTPEIAFVLGLLGAATVLLVTGRVRADVVALLVVLALLLSHLLGTEEGLAGFSSPAVITIAAIFIVTAGLANTGIAAWLGGRVLRIAGSDEPRLLTALMGTAAVLSLVMNNIAAASVLLPAVIGISRQTGIRPSRLLMPLSFGTILGGMATLFTTTNILINDALRARDLAPFTFGDYFRIGSLITLAGIGFLVLFGRRLLPAYAPKTMSPIRRLPEDLAELYQVPERLFEVGILSGSVLDGCTIAQSRFGQRYDLNILGILRDGRAKLAPTRSEVLQAGDRLLVEGEPVRLKERAQELGVFLPNRTSQIEMDLRGQDVAMVEVVLSPRSAYHDRTLKDIHFRDKYGLTVVAIWREGSAIRHGIADTPIRFGDALLVQGRWRDIERLKSEPDFIVLDQGMPEITQPQSVRWAIFSLALMVALGVLGVTRTVTAVLLAAILMVLSGALTMEEAYRSIEWRSVVLIAGMLPLGTALDKTGAARLIADQVLQATGDLGPVAVLAGLFVLSLLLAQAMSAAATAVLMAPIGLSAAVHLGINPRPLMMAIVLGTSSAFLTPVSHPANVLVMGPGGYRFSDYARVGVFLSLIVFVLVVLLVPRFWPF